MSVIKQLTNLKFTPASSEVNWTRVETLVHGPGAGDDKRSTNSAVFACLMAIASSYPEPPIQVYQKLGENKNEALPEHPLQQLLETPTPAGELSMEEMLFWTAWAKHTDGNAYWVKVRSGNELTGNVVQLWPVSPTRMQPVTEERGPGQTPDWISYYKYRESAERSRRIPVQNVVHFRLGLDDRDMRKGLSPLKALVRQITTDDEADKFIAELLQNYAVPGLVVVPAQGSFMDESDADKITEKLRQKFGTGKRGNIAVMSKESKIEQFGFSPKDLDMSMLHRIPEERISAVMGVPAIIAGLGAGLERATYDNAREMGEWFTERKLIPQWRSDAAKINTSLRPDFTNEKDIYAEFDLKKVRALQDDVTDTYTRLSVAVGKPFMTRNEARSEVGMAPRDGWDEEDQQPPAPPTPPQPEDNPPAPDDQADELRTWRRWALKQVAGGGITRDFETQHIPPALAGAISGALEAAKTPGDVEQIFSDLWLGYP